MTHPTCYHEYCDACVEQRARERDLKPETIRTIWALRPVRAYGRKIIRGIRVVMP